MGRVKIRGWLFVLLVAALVEVAFQAFDLHDSIAAPSDAIRALVEELSSGELATALRETLEAYVQGFVVAIAIGVGLGVIIGSSRTLSPRPPSSSSSCVPSPESP